MPFLALVYMDDHTADGVRRLGQITGEMAASGRIVGLFDFPNRSKLKCNGSCVQKKLSSWSRDPRGFMKCNVCGSRPRKLRSRLIGHLFDLLGANLYEDAPGAFRTPEGYGIPHADNG